METNYLYVSVIHKWTVPCLKESKPVRSNWYLYTTLAVTAPSGRLISGWTYQSSSVSRTGLSWLETTQNSKCQGFPLSPWGVEGFKNQTGGGGGGPWKLDSSLLMKWTVSAEFPQKKTKCKRRWDRSSSSLSSRSGTLSVAVWWLHLSHHRRSEFTFNCRVRFPGFLGFIFFENGQMWRPKCCSLHV